jgi:hypothetical protein
MTGTLLADDDGLNVNFQLNDLIVGNSVGGAATGTLRWNQTEAIQANRVIFGANRGSTGILDVPTGGSFLLGTPSERIGELSIAHDATTSGVAGTTTSSDLDFTVTNPTFEAYIGSDLLIGRKTLVNGENTVVGSLTLGSNSLLDVGTVAAPANVRIGANSDTDSSAMGGLDTRSGISNIQASNVNVGTSSGGTATGILSIGANDLITATTVNIGVGANATGTVNLEDGRLLAQTINANGLDSTFNFTGGRLGLGGETLAAGTFNGTLYQQGGTLAPGFSRTETSEIGTATINGDYNLFSGILEIDLFGTDPGSLYDQVFVNGLVDLNGDDLTGGTLDLNLGFAPSLGDSFIIVDNDSTDPITTAFFGLEEGASLTEFFGGQAFLFEITYAGGTGNDIVLNAVPIPPAVWLFGSGLLGLVGVARRRAVL